MKVRVGAIVAGGLLAFSMLASPMAAHAVNQGDEDKVITVDNPNVNCQYPTAEQKVESNNLGKTINISANDPIDFVTIKSGNGASVVSATFNTTSATITLSKDVSNYVVWTCDEQPT
jgi:hypothetical protein